MEKFHNITKAQADLITRFEYAPHKVADPYANEQEDGSSLVSQKMYLLLKSNPNFKKVDWTKVPLIDKDQLKPKL